MGLLDKLSDYSVDDLKNDTSKASGDFSDVVGNANVDRIESQIEKSIGTDVPVQTQGANDPIIRQGKTASVFAPVSNLLDGSGLEKSGLTANKPLLIGGGVGAVLLVGFIIKKVMK